MDKKCRKYTAIRKLRIKDPESRKDSLRNLPTVSKNKKAMKLMYHQIVINLGSEQGDLKNNSL